MLVIRPGAARSVGERLFSAGVRLIQSYVVRPLDARRKVKRRPYTLEFEQRMRSLGVDLNRIGWDGPMTLLPRKAEYVVGEIDARPPRRLLEVGAGSSTLLFAALGHKYGFDVVSLENHEGSVAFVKALLAGTPFSDRVTLQICDFRRHQYPDGKKYWWYAADLECGGGYFDFVFVDGPMESLVGRNGALPEVIPYMTEGGRLFLDDTGRSAGRQILAEWQEHFPEISVCEEFSGVGKIVVRKTISRATTST